jgi:hypothetical protein
MMVGTCAVFLGSVKEIIELKTHQRCIGIDPAEGIP